MTPCLFNRNQGLPRSGRTVYDGTSLLREKIQDSALLAQHSVKHRVFQINIKSGRRKYVELRTQHFVDKFAKFTIRVPCSLRMERSGKTGAPHKAKDPKVLPFPT